MRYQDLKIRDGLRLFWLGCIGALAALMVSAFRATLLPILDANPRHPYFWPLVIGLSFLAMAGWIGSLYYLLSSPRQNKDHVDWMVRRLGAKLPPDFDSSLFDSQDPMWGVPTVKYWQKRCQRN